LAGKIPFMQLRGDVWYFRRIVPSELRAIVGKNEYLKKLSADLREAKRLVALEIVRSDQDFQRGRQMVRSNAEFDAACLAALTDPMFRSRIFVSPPLNLICRWQS
jgi:hypothetical protein